MKKTALFIFCLLLCSTLSAQEVTAIAATIIDEKTKEPVEFVNIGFAEKGIGTVSNANGNFSLTWSSDVIKDAQFLEISSIGYETKQLALNELSRLNSYKSIIYLMPKEYDLDEVVIVNEKREFDRLGSSVYAKKRVGYWMNMKGLGGEIATQVKVNKRNTKLHSLTFNILENQGDSLLVRVKVYDYHRGFPGKNLVTKNIYHTITKKEGEETIPLKKYNIIAHDDIIVSLELVEVYGSTIYFSVSASPYRGVSYTREISLDGWKVYRDVGISFNLISSYPSKSEEKSIVSRPKPEKIDLYWDTSLPMKNRNVDEELKLLSRYLRHLDEAQIRAIKFSKGIETEKVFAVENGRNKELIAYLENSLYQGASDFSKVLKTNQENADAALLFTNGESLYSELRPTIAIPVFCINSIPKANDYQLQLISYLSGGHYVNLTKVQLKNALGYLQFDIQDEHAYDQNQIIDKSGYVHGVVYNDNGVPLQGATVAIKNTFTEVKTGPNGSYAINASPGEILSIEAFGMYRKDTVVGELKKLHIPMRTDRELLDEVYLETKNISNEIANEIVSTPFGKKKRGAIGFSMANRFTSEDIRPQDANIDMILQRMPGVILSNNSGLAGAPQKYIFRKTFNNSLLNGGDTYPVIILDDMLYDQMSDQTMPPINTQTIESITLLKTALSTVRYGQLAAYGAIVIETKEYAANKNKESSLEKKKTTPNLLVTGNDYIENPISFDMVERKAPQAEYLLKLESADSFLEAKEIYLSQVKTYGDKVHFYIDSATFFRKWDNTYSESILSNIAALAPDNIKALKTLAYQYDALENKVAASQIYEQIVDLAPNEVQSYLDVASSYVATGAIDTAFALYTQLIYNTIPNVDASQVQDQVISELQHLMAHHKSKVNFNLLPDAFLKIGYKQDIRMVFDWNDTATEFEIQFVSPKNKYFTFSHTTFDNGPLLARETMDGFTSKEFILDNAESGRWLININYRGKEEVKNPTYLKYTLYRNYGLPSETKEVKVVNLSAYHQKITLDSFQL